MFDISIKEAADIAGGKIYCTDSGYNLDKTFKSLVIDSRSAREGDLFVAYKGKGVDGHDYIGKAFENGAVCAISDRPFDGAEKPVIVVDDVQLAVEKIMTEFRTRVTCPVIGVSGSVGKTTTKEMIFSVLSQEKNAVKTDKNLNNLLGVPMSLSRIEKTHEAAVIEMGISLPGEMERLAKMVRPDYMVLTKIGHAHLEFLKDLEGVFREKTAVIPYMNENGTVVINGDDEYLDKLECTQKIVRYGLGDNCDVKASSISYNDGFSVSFDILYEGRKIPVSIPAFGRHLVYSALGAASVGFVMGYSDESIKKGIESFSVVGRRGAVVKTDSLILIDDCYNSNMDSCKSSLLSMTDLHGRHVAIVGDFLEQGDQGISQHEQVGEFAKNIGVELVIGVGPLGKHTSDFSFDTKEELMEALPEILKKDDVVLVKASLGAHLEDVSELIRTLSLK